MYTKLMPLRIPTGWGVFHNNFCDVEVESEDGKIINQAYFDQDLLWIEQMMFKDDGWKQAPQGYFIDLGWYPDTDPNGTYKLEVFKGGRDHQVLKFVSKDRFEIKKAIEEAIGLILDGTPPEKISQIVKGNCKEGSVS